MGDRLWIGFIFKINSQELSPFKLILALKTKEHEAAFILLIFPSRRDLKKPPFSLSKIFPYKGPMYLIKYVRPQRSTGARIGLLQNRDLDRDIGRFSTRRAVYKGIGSSELQNRPFRRFPTNRTSLWEFFGPCTLE